MFHRADMRGRALLWIKKAARDGMNHNVSNFLSSHGIQQSINKKKERENERGEVE